MARESDLAYLIRTVVPAPFQGLVALIFLVVLLRPVLRTATTLSPSLKQLPFPLSIIAMDVPQVPMLGFTLPGWFGTAAITVAGLALAAGVIVAGIWWQGPGAMERRKKARQELRLNLFAKSIQDKRMQDIYRKADRASRTADQ